MFTRRDMIKGLMLTGGFCLLPMAGRGWALAAPQAADRRLIVILMRGAVDGLSIVTPYMDRNYYNARPNIAIQPPRQQGGLIDLDGFFGLHPSLVDLMPLWQNRSLAFIHASGSPATTRSHFEAQDVLETAMLNTAMASQGWMNGLAQILPDNHSAMRALSYGDRLPKIFQGKYNVATLPTRVHITKEDPRIDGAFSQLYDTHSELGGLYKQGMAAQASVSDDMQNEMQNSAQGAPGTDAFVVQTTQAAAMIRRDPSIQLMFMDVGGWDTHVGQGNAKGQLAGRLDKFGEGLAALVNGLGASYQNTAILVMSEFGRTVAENGNAGTDHGHGNVAWLMGGGVQGGKVWGRWPGLDRGRLYEGRDLAVTTDFRAIIGAVLSGHLGVDDARIAALIPDYAADKGLDGIVA